MRFKLPGFRIPRVRMPHIAFRGFGFLKLIKWIISPRTVVAVVIIAAIAAGVLFQSQIKARLFPKPEEKAKIGAQVEEALPQEPILVKVYKTQRRDFEDMLPALGNVKGFKEIDLKFEISGVLDSFNFKEGERVEEGEIIATLNQKDALLKLRYNEIEQAKNQKLFDIGAISSAKMEQTNIELESAKRELDRTYLYAPRSGVLATKDSEIGEFTMPNEKVATLIDDSEVYVDVGIIERDIGKIKTGQAAQVTVDTYPDVEFKGTVDSISPVVEGRSRTQSAKIKIKNSERRLVPGMFARASCAVYKAEGVVVIPNAAIDKTEEGYVTYVVKKPASPAGKDESAERTGEDIKAILGKKETPAEEAKMEEEGVVEARPIKADYRSPEFFVVREGLEEGDLVVVETQEKLKDGLKVIITEVQETIF